ncbi:MAG: pyridoxal phosphate-dependent aminotransferase [Chloroflexota bacterium]
MRVATKMQRLGTETAFEMLARARALEAQGKHIVHLEIGEPDFDTPENIVDAAVDALHEGWTHYGPSAGLPDLKAAIASESAAVRGVPFSPEQVVVTPGAKPIMFFVIMALIEEGDECIYPNPGFPIYESMINFMGGVPVPVRLREDREFRFDVGELREKVTDRTRLIILNSPQNPTGGVLTRSDLEEVARIAIEHDIPVLTDEVYRRIIYQGEHFSIASVPGMADKAIILDGFSKTYAMTGWRLGYGILPLDLVPHISRLMTNSASCTASFIQRAGVEAIIGPQEEPQRYVEEFRRRRDVVVDGLNSIPGFSCLRPQGAFYVFPNITKTGKTSTELADYLLAEAGVATLSGGSFGEYGEGYLRLSYANSVENLELALQRIKAAVAKL